MTERMKGNKMADLEQLYKHCVLCPRACGVNRLKDERGFCGMPAESSVARVSLHQWEEPCISGKNGSGTVFFAGCSLGCVYCQNGRIISGNVIEGGGGDLNRCKVKDSHALASDYLLLEKSGAHNINLVTASHFLPQVVESLRIAKEEGLSIPVVYNTSGYERPDALRLLKDLVDIWLTDFRYMHSETAAAYSSAPDYPEAATEALREMMSQSELSFDSDGMMRKGVIVRVLLLPGHVKEAEEILSYIWTEYGDRLYISLLSQYTPVRKEVPDPLLLRKVTAREYRRFLDFALSCGISNAFIQEGSSAEESFIPEFDGDIHLTDNVNKTRKMQAPPESP